jgi:hypothetical protein
MLFTGKYILFSGNTYNRVNMNDRDHNNPTKFNNVDCTPQQSEVITSFEEQQTNRRLMLQHFTTEFVENHKQCYLFNGVIEELIKGADPYTIIQQLIEHRAAFDNNQKLNS